MARMAIVTDVDRCVGCHACTVACKVMHEMPVGRYWNRVLRIGPNPKEGGSGNWPDVEMYFLNLSCQHCATPECVSVCPTGATTKTENGTVQIDPNVCIGCESCIPACPYGVRYLNEDTGVVEKCNLCQDIIDSGEVDLPRCVSQCCGMARWYGDLDEGIETFRGPRGEVLGDYLEEFSEDQVYKLEDSGNGPEFLYICRTAKWRPENVVMP